MLDVGRILGRHVVGGSIAKPLRAMYERVEQGAGVVQIPGNVLQGAFPPSDFRGADPVAERFPGFARASVEGPQERTPLPYQSRWEKSQHQQIQPEHAALDPIDPEPSARERLSESLTGGRRIRSLPTPPWFRDPRGPAWPQTVGDGDAWPRGVAMTRAGGTHGEAASSIGPGASTLPRFAAGHPPFAKGIGDADRRVRGAVPIERRSEAGFGDSATRLRAVPRRGRPNNCAALS